MAMYSNIFRKIVFLPGKKKKKKKKRERKKQPVCLERLRQGEVFYLEEFLL